VTAIAISHAHIVEAQESLFTTLKEHEEAQQRLQHSMDLAAPKFEAVVEQLLGSAEALGKTLDETEIRVQKLGSQRQFWSPLGLCAVGLLLLLGVDREKIVAGTLVVTGTRLIHPFCPWRPKLTIYIQQLFLFSQVLPNSHILFEVQLSCSGPIP
jgi:hypothetical protein